MIHFKLIFISVRVGIKDEFFPHMEIQLAHHHIKTSHLLQLHHYYNQVTISMWSFSGLWFSLFCRSARAPIAPSIAAASPVSLRISSLKWLFFTPVLALLGPLHFHPTVSISLLAYRTLPPGVVSGGVSNLYISLRKMIKQ